MTTTRLFKSNTTQAVRLPKAVAFPEGVTEVEIVVDGDARILRPVRAELTWSDFFDLIDEYGGAGDDFLADRDEGLIEVDRGWP